MPPSTSAISLLDVSRQQLESHRHAEAAHNLHAALAIEPAHADAYLLLGDVALEQSDWKSSIRWLRKGAALNPRSSQAWLLLGATLGDSEWTNPKMLKEATSALQTAVRLEPHNSNAYWQLGDVHAACGARRLAVQTLARAVSLHPKHVGAYSSLARVLTYETASTQAAQIAAWAFRQTLRLAPDHMETWHNLGENLFANGEPEKSAVAFARAIAIRPASGQSLLMRGESLQRVCRLDEAQVHYARAATLLPRSARAQVHALIPQRPSAGPVPQFVAPPREHPAPALPPASALAVDPTESDWQARAHTILETYGVVVLKRLVTREVCDALLRQILAWPLGAEGTSRTTRQPYRRRHQALPLRSNASGVAAHAISNAAGPMLAAALETPAPRIVESGFLLSEPGAVAQALHADTSPPHLLACEARTLKVQLALVPVREDMGPLEVVPGTHRDHRVPTESRRGHHSRGSHSSAMGEQGRAETSNAAVLALPILVEPGDTTLYWASLQHRGGANSGSSPRPTFHVAYIAEGGAPTGIPYTVLVDDIIAMYDPARGAQS